MPPKKNQAKISGMVDSDIEDDILMDEGKQSLESETEPAAKKTRGRPKDAASKVTNAKTAAPKRGRAASAATKKEPRARRATGAKKSSVEDGIETGTEQVTENEDVEMGDSLENEVEKALASDDELDSPKTVTEAKNQDKVKNPRGRGRSDAKTEDIPKEDQEDDEFVYTPKKSGTNGRVKQINTSGATKKPVGHKRKASSEPQKTVIPETQVEVMRDSPDIEEQVAQQTPRAVRSRINGRAASRTRQQSSVRRPRAGSASDTERNGGDPTLRRKLGDMTRKFENVDLKYRNLRDVGILEANANVEKLRKQCEAQAAASAELITSLKKELAVQTTLAQESRSLQKQLNTRETEYATLETQFNDVTSELSDAQNEIKTLQAKLSASRTASASVESATINGRIPSSAVKANHGRTVIMGSAETAEAARVAQLKEDLYSDLTGLIVRGVKRVEGTDEIYDCIQTGRNGTLHFKLSLNLENNDDGTTKQQNFEEAEFLYTPLLDENRDRDLLDILPDYLTEDITFSRQHAAKFYSRVVDTLTKRVE